MSDLREKVDELIADLAVCERERDENYDQAVTNMDRALKAEARLAKMREGAVERVGNILDEISNASQLAWVGDVTAFATRIVDAVLGKE
jgi:hypothetical protein